jgi:hypothetical protein
MAGRHVDLIGLVGRKGSGKDTAAKALTTQGWTRLAFATPLREVIQTMFLLDDEHCETPRLKELPGPMGVSYRRGMQAVGTELVRNQLSTVLPEAGMEGFWVQHMRRQIERARTEGKRVVITDVRFRDEAEMIRQMGGALVHIRRPGIDTSNLHSSETGVDDIIEVFAPLVLENTSTIVALQEGMLGIRDDLDHEAWDEWR